MPPETSRLNERGSLRSVAVRRPPRVGVLLSNLGTPAVATPAALRAYLKEFLSDPRVIELPRWKWLPILHLFVLPTRPKMSAELYRKVWTAAGSPLLVTSQRPRAGIEQRFQRLREEEHGIAVAFVHGYPLPAKSGMVTLTRCSMQRRLRAPPRAAR